MVVGIWYGRSKPILNEYIEQFVAELHLLLEAGLSINGHLLDIRFGAVICDTPARSLLKGILFIYDFCHIFSKFFVVLAHFKLKLLHFVH